MGLFDTIQAAAGGLAGEGQGGVLGHLTEMVGNPQTGGIGGLVRTFQEKGLGGLVASWVSTGANLPIGADQITAVLGQDRVQKIAAATGMDPATLAGHISTMLPGLIDKLTPDGKLPDGTTAEQIAGGMVPAS